MILETLNQIVIPLQVLFYIVSFSVLGYVFYQFFHEELKQIGTYLYRFRAAFFLYVGTNLALYFLLQALEQWIKVSWLSSLSFPISIFIIYYMVFM